jgi:hypothetical protein
LVVELSLKNIPFGPVLSLTAHNQPSAVASRNLERRMCGVTALWQEHSAEGIAGSAKSFGIEVGGVIEIGREDRHLKLWRDTPLSGCGRRCFLRRVAYRSRSAFV